MLTDNRNYRDLRMNVRKQFLTEALLGEKARSKQFSPQQFEDTREEPILTTILLQAWALWRMRQPERFLQEKSARREVWLRELDFLRESLAAAPRQPNAKAVGWLRQWVPEALGV